MTRKPLALLLGAALLFPGWACSSDGPSPTGSPGAATLASVTPRGGSMGVDPGATITMEFTSPMMDGMEALIDLHEGDLDGPPVPGTWSWSADRMRLTFTPGGPLDPGTTYFLHMAGGMMDADGHRLDYGTHGPGMGGEWDRMGMMGGTEGMYFPFTTAG